MLGGLNLMKKLLKGLVFGSVLAGLTVATAVPTFAQQSCDDDADTKAAVYAKFTENYKSDDVAKIQTAVAGAKEYIQKYASCEGEDPTIPNYLKKAYPKLEEKVAVIKNNDADKALYNRFNDAVKGDVNASQAFKAGEDILAKDDTLDLRLVLASIGFDEAVKEPPNNTLNNKTIDYAESAIQKIKSGETSKKDWGAYKWIYKNNDYADGKSNALGWMNYTIGYIKFFRQGKKEEALPYLYEATKYNSGTKKDPFVYQTLGKHYLDKTKELAAKYTEEVKKNNNEETDEAKRLFGLQKAYADRAVDSYARAYSYAKMGTDKAYADGLYKTLEGLYTFRNDGKADGLEGYVAGINNRTMPDPASEVQPIVPASNEEDMDKTDTDVKKPDSNMKKSGSTDTKKPESNMKKSDSTDTKNKTETPAKKADSTTVTVKKEGTKTPKNGTTKPKKP